MVDCLSLIRKYYEPQSETYPILVKHSSDVAHMAAEIALRHPELGIDNEFVAEAAMLHDIGICHTLAPTLGCHGTLPYICHGYLGAEMLRKEGLERHARVAERHTGAGISLGEIVRRALPIPHREMIPHTMEEQVVCFADKFFSKTGLNCPYTVEVAREKIKPFGQEGVDRFNAWCRLFF